MNVTRLKVIEDLADALELEAIRYCHWKSNAHLARTLSGDADLDLLVDPQQKFPFIRILIRLGFKQAFGSHDSRFPGIVHFYGWDPDSGRFVDVHAHFRLIAGSDLVKNYALPIVAPYLDSGTTGRGLRTPEVEFEYVVFVTRMVLKRRLLPWILGQPDPRIPIRTLSKGGRPPLTGSEAEEWSGFRGHVNRDRLLTILADHLPSVTEDLFAACERSITPDAGRWDWLTAGRQLTAALKPYQRDPTFTTVVRATTRRVASLSRALVRRLPGQVGVASKRRLAAGGMLIAFVGGDGSGKSSNMDALEEWLAGVFEVVTFHLGRPRLGLARRLYIVLSKAIRVPMGNPREAAVRPLHAVTHILVARRRWRLVRAAHEAADSGRVVICDRYPTEVLKLSEAPIVPTLGRDQSWVMSRLASAERHYYSMVYALPEPDLFVVLKVDPQISIDRKPEEDPDFVRPRLEEILTADWSTLKSVETIDSSEPLAAVLDQVRRVVWDRLPACSPQVEVIGPAGAGKTTLVGELLRSYPVTSGRALSPKGHPILVAKNAARLWWALRDVTFAEAKRMVMTTTKFDLWERREAYRESPVLHDQGPFFANAFDLWARRGRTMSDRFLAWHFQQIERASHILDLVVWLDMSNDVLVNRIESRHQEHVLKGESSDAQAQFLDDYRDLFRKVSLDASGASIFTIEPLAAGDDDPRNLADRVMDVIDGAT